MFKKTASIVALFTIGILLIVYTSQGEEYLSDPIIDKYKYSDELPEIKELYITILKAEENSDEYNYTFNEMNEKFEEDIRVEVIFQEGKDGSPKVGLYGYGLTNSNATMELRGQSSRNASIKSYKIKINNDSELWNGEEIINLNKHNYDDIRIRNKLSYDYLALIPNITSLETQFTHLYIKDFSEGDFNQNYIDYGLYTQVENIDNNFLVNHGLDSKGTIYKAEYFEFFRYPDYIKLPSNEDYSKVKFEEILEIKTNDNPEKLIDMLNDVNNELIHINDVIDEHFNRENYITWLATNILIGNIDTGSRNFLLYSPSDIKTWYFLPWDYDGTWGFVDKMGVESDIVVSCHEGIANYWGVVLHRRFFENEQNVLELTKKIEELSTNIFTTENTKMFLDSYKPVVSEFYYEKPYILYQSWTEEEINAEWNRLFGIIERNKEKYYISIENPMPVFMGKPINEGEYFVFIWNNSYDLQGDNIEYSIDISDTYLFDNIIYHAEGIKDTQHIVNNLYPGIYYWRLFITDSRGNTQNSFNQYAVGYHIYYGVQEFYVE